MRRVAPILALALAACGGKTDSISQGDCPTAQPEDGSACAKEGIDCEYGDDPRYSCNSVASCSNGKWSVTASDDAWCPTPGANPASCPASFDQTGTCTDDDVGVPCQYAEGWCSCIFVGGPPTPDGGGPDTSWMCFDRAQVTSGCPTSRPRLGTTCAQADLECDYSPCGTPSGLAVRCDDATMTWSESFGSPCGGASSN